MRYVPLLLSHACLFAVRFDGYDATAFWLDFPHEVTQRYDSICREAPEYAEMIMYYLVECGTDHYHELSEDDFRELIQAQYGKVMEDVY